MGDNDNDFTVVLPSNSNMRLQPNNKPNSYTVELPHEIKLNGDWEAALLGIQYTHGWVTLRHKVLVMFLVLPMPDEPYGNTTSVAFHQFHLNPNHEEMYIGGSLTPYAEKEGSHMQILDKTAYGELMREYQDKKITNHCGYFPGGYYEDVNEVGQALVKLFYSLHPDTPIKLLFDYDYVEKRTKFRSMYGEVCVMTTDPQLGTLLGLESRWVNCQICKLNTNGTINWQRLRHRLAELNQAADQRARNRANQNTERRREINMESDITAVPIPETQDGTVKRVRRALDTTQETLQETLQETPQDTDRILTEADMADIHENEIRKLESLLAAHQEEEEEVVEETTETDTNTRPKRSVTSYKQATRVATPRHFWMLANYANKAPKINRVNDLWIYSDIIDRQIVGDAKVPLLGIIPSTARTGNRCYHTPNPLNYVSISKNIIKSIHIEIRDDKGDPVKFLHDGPNEDNVICTLRFRRRRPKT